MGKKNSPDVSVFYSALTTEDDVGLAAWIQQHNMVNITTPEAIQILNIYAHHGFLQGMKLAIEAFNPATEVIGKMVIRASRNAKNDCLAVLLPLDPIESDLADALHGAIVQSSDPMWHTTIDLLWSACTPETIKSVIDDIVTDYKHHQNMYGYQKWKTIEDAKMLHEHVDKHVHSSPSRTSKI